MDLLYEAATRSVFLMGDRDYRCNQTSLTILQITRTELHTGSQETLYRREGFRPPD